MSDMTDDFLAIVRTDNLVISRQALEHIPQDVIFAGLKFHFEFDWTSHDCPDNANDAPVVRCRQITPWLDSKGSYFWIVTEVERSLTTVFLREEL